MKGAWEKKTYFKWHQIQMNQPDTLDACET